MCCREDGEQGRHLFVAILVHVGIDVLVQILIREVVSSPWLFLPARSSGLVSIRFAICRRAEMVIEVTRRGAIAFYASAPGSDGRGE